MANPRCNVRVPDDICANGANALEVQDLVDAGGRPAYDALVIWFPAWYVTRGTLAFNKADEQLRKFTIMTRTQKFMALSSVQKRRGFDDGTFPEHWRDDFYISDVRWWYRINMRTALKTKLGEAPATSNTDPISEGTEPNDRVQVVLIVPGQITGFGLRHGGLLLLRQSIETVYGDQPLEDVLILQLLRRPQS